MLIQFPFHFEYNETLLLFMADEIYNHKYGTFLQNCERDREIMRVRDQTESMWTYVLLHRHRFINRYYNKNDTKEVIPCIPTTSAFALSEWRELHFKWTSKAFNISI